MATTKPPRWAVLLLFALAFWLGWNQYQTSPAVPDDPLTEEERAQFKEKDLTYQGRTLRVTKHARCRMNCRKLDAYEVQQVINQGEVNRKKSKPAQGDRCKSLAYEGRSPDGPRARIIIGECEDAPILITVIDLDHKYDCFCE